MEERIPLIRAAVARPTPGSPAEEESRIGRGPHDTDKRETGRRPSPPSTASPSTSSTHPGLESYFERDVYVGHAKRFISDLKPYEALALVPLSFCEMGLTKVTGTVAGSVYKSLVDLDRQLLYTTVYKAALYYALFAVLAAAQEYAKDSLALVWRRRLAKILHGAYLRDPLRMRAIHSKLDNCDQRMTSEVEGLCSTLADIVHKVAASPFKVIFYGYLAGSYIGISSLCLVVAFFSASIWLQKLVALPLARDLVRLERQEGDFRSQHMRVKRHSTDIGLQSERTAEAWVLDGAMERVLGAQGAVVWRRTAVMGVTRLVDYGGALMNYVAIALAIFWGDAGGSDDPSAGPEGGDRAAFVSNASFFTLTFIYTLTEVIDLGSTVSTMISLLCRVYGMLEVLQGGREEHHPAIMDPVERAEHGSPPGLSLARSPAEGSPRGVYEVVLEPTMLALEGASPATPAKPAIMMEVAVLTLRGTILDEVAGVFPSMQSNWSDQSNANTQVTCIMTLQPRQPLDLDAMDASLGVFLGWEQAMAQQLGGAWCDAVDPKTGRALRDIGASASTSASWSEVRAFHTFLKYPVDERGACPLIVHPAYGSDTYPVSFFTTASPHSCIEALRRIGNLHDCRGSDDDPASLRIQNETIWPGELNAREGAPLLTGINLRLQIGRHVLITGPNGSGKTTLMRYLCKRLQEQEMDRNRPRQATCSPRNLASRYMYLPQIPLIAPGRHLWQQLAYPSRAKPSDGDMLGVLERVGLRELAAWLPELPSTARDWSTCLSFGEQQRLCIARVCLCKPSFALMDEATSGMDANSSVGLIREVQRVSTVVLVAHDVDALHGLFPVRVDL